MRKYYRILFRIIIAVIYGAIVWLLFIEMNNRNLNQIPHYFWVGLFLLSFAIELIFKIKGTAQTLIFGLPLIITQLLVLFIPNVYDFFVWLL